MESKTIYIGLLSKLSGLKANIDCYRRVKHWISAGCYQYLHKMVYLITEI
jgi:hypothetical protein